MRGGGGTYTSPSLRYPARFAYFSLIGRIMFCSHGRMRRVLVAVKGGIWNVRGVQLAGGAGDGGDERVVVVGGWRIYEVSGPQILERGGVDRGTGGSNRLSD